MAGSMALVLMTEQPSPLEVVETAMRWEVQYSRFFGYSHLAGSVRRINSGGTWLSSSTPTAVLSLSANPSVFDFILTVTLHGKILEQHYVSKLQFSWPQLSCLSNIPGRASQVLFASYRDETSVTQKFCLRFPTNYEIGRFIAMLEVIFSNKQYSGDFLIAASSQSEAKDMLSEVTAADASQMLEMNPLTLHPPKVEQLQEDEQSHSIVVAPNHGFEGYVPDLPPRFTSLVTNCSEMVQGEVVVANTPSDPSVSHEADLKSLIVRYLDDASFLEILSKAEEVIAEMGGGMAIQEYL